MNEAAGAPVDKSAESHLPTTELRPRADPLVALSGWLEQHTSWVVLVLVVIGLLLRVRAAVPTMLNPDEALNFISADHDTLAAAIRGGMTNPHPPLYYILLWLWKFVGRSDFMLRLPSVLAGAAAVWVAFEWMKEVFGRRAGIIGAAALALAPEMVALSAEVRSYAIHVLLVGAMLLFLERALTRRSVQSMLLSGLVLVLAILNHYSALVLMAAIGTYALVGLLVRRPGRAVTMSWLAGQFAALCAATLLYAVHVVGLRGGAMETFAKTGWLRASYFQAGQDSAILFPLRQSRAVFDYLFSSPVVGMLAAALCLLGAVLLIAGAATQFNRSPRREASIILVLPFAAALAAALAGLHPYGGSRHSFYLLTFAVAGISYTLSRVAGRRFGAVLFLLIAAAPAWLLLSRPGGGQYLRPSEQRRFHVRQAVAHVLELIPKYELVLADQQSQIILQRYLCSGPALVRYGKRFNELECKGVRVVWPVARWRFGAKGFTEEIQAVATDYGLKQGQTVCVFNAGWGWNLKEELSWKLNIAYPDAKQFGRSVSVLLVPIGQEPASSTDRRLLDSLSLIAARRFAGRLRAVFWPTDHFVYSEPAEAELPAERAMSYAELYRDSSQDRGWFSSHLPALAFWTFNNCERHPEFMRYMDDAENYISAGLRFTLLAVDPDTLAGVYLIEPLPAP